MILQEPADPGPALLGGCTDADGAGAVYRATASDRGERAAQMGLAQGGWQPVLALKRRWWVRRRLQVPAGAIARVDRAQLLVDEPGIDAAASLAVGRRGAAAAGSVIVLATTVEPGCRLAIRLSTTRSSRL